MSPIRVALLCLVSLTVLPLPILRAQDGGAPPSLTQAPGTTVLEPTQDMLGTATYSGAAPVGPFGGYLFFRKDIGHGVGYEDGYSNVGWFQPVQLIENGVLFGQAQFFVTDNGEWGGNLGGGYRHYFPSIDRLIGGYGFYDTDESARGIDYDQLSIGVETLGRRWDARANAYFPLSEETNIIGAAGPLGITPSFVGRNLVFNGAAFFEKAMPGADVEIGLPIFDPSAFGRLRAYAGGYVYDSEEKNPAGVRVRLESHLNQYFTIGAAFLHDDVHGGQATIAVDVRAWSKRLPPITNHRPTQEPKLYLPVTRVNRVAVDRFVQDINALALGQGGQELDFVWVDNSNPNAGDGTFENPFRDMPGNAPGADYVIVRQGASTIGNPVLGGITLEDGQNLFGEGFRFAIPVTGTQFGNGALAGNYNIDTLIPGWDVNGFFPFISNPSGNVITLASDNQVAGFNIIDSPGHGITGSGITDFTLFNLNIGNVNPAFGNGGAAISLTNASGVGTIDNFTFLNNAGGGLLISNNGAAPLQLSVSGRANVDPNVIGGTQALRLSATNSVIVADIEDFLSTGAGAGLQLQASVGGQIDAEITNSAFDNTTAGHAVDVIANGAIVNLLMSDTTANDSAGHGINIVDNNGTVGLALTNVTADGSTGNGMNVSLTNNAVFSGSVTGGSLSGSGGHGVNLLTDASSSALNLLAFSQTSVNGSGGDGLHIELTDGSFFDVRFQNGQINGSGGDAIDMFVDGGSTLNLLVNPSALNGSGENGIRFDVRNSSFLFADVLDSSIANSGQHGMLGVVDTGSFAELNFNNTFVTASGLDGFNLTARGGSDLLVDLMNGSTSIGNQNGIVLLTENAGTAATLTVSSSFVSSNGLRGLDLLAQDGAELNVALLNTARVQGNGRDGVRLQATDAGTVANLVAQSAIIDGNGLNNFPGEDNGIALIVDAGAELNAQLDLTSASGNGGHGLLLDATGAGTVARIGSLFGFNSFDDNGGFGAQINAAGIDELDVVLGAGASGNALGGMQFNIDNVTTVTNAAVAGPGAVSGNGGIGVEFNINNVTIDNLGVDGVFITQNDGHGVAFNLTDATIQNLLVLNSSASQNLGNGVLLDATNSAVAALLIDNNTIDGNTLHGIEFLVSNSTLPGPATPGVISDNSISGNGGDGVRLVLPDTAGADIGLDFVGNDISGNQIGINVELDNATGQFVSVSSDNTVDDNTSFGLRLVSTQASTFDASFDGGSFSQNGDAGVGVTMNSTSSGRLVVDNATISGNTAGLDPNFAGQGVLIRMLQNATLLGTSSFSGNIVNGNGTAGLDFHVQDTADILGGVLIDGNTISNTGDGIRFTRLASGTVGAGSAIVISNNTISGGADGIELIARNGFSVDQYNLVGNDILNVGGRGVVLEQGFDAPMRVDMDGNLIDGSGSDGIFAFNTAGTIGAELRELVGTWQNNTIINSGGDGIELSGLMGRFLGTLVVTNSTISDNTAIGINQTGGGQADFTFNTVEGNGGGGIYVTGSGFKALNINDNQIRFNEGDGLRIVNNGNSGGFGYTIAANNNEIEFNTQRGINVLNQGTADTDLVMNGNTINGNLREGVFVMNSASTTQSADFGAALAADGLVTATPNLNLTFNNNDVFGNGNAGTPLNSGGFVMRVGTADGNTSFTDPGGFANTRAGVVAFMDGNTFTGNQGSDVYFDSFTSTVNPATTGGTWTDQNENPRDGTDDTFNPTGFRADPLARLDLVFTNNTGDEQQMTNTGASYNNDEPVFKSRTAGQDNGTDGGLDDNGPFSSGTRTRNAQRLAFRGALPPDLTILGAGGNSDNFLFSGVGSSTFRVNASGNTFSSPFGTGFIFDSQPFATYTDPANHAGGVPGTAPNGGPEGIDNMPWGWSILP